MPRLSVYVPTELHRALRERLAGVNISRLLQDALREALGCSHAQLACAQCAEPIDQFELADRALSEFYKDFLWHLERVVHAGGTAEGAARVAKEVALRHRVSVAKRWPLPRPSRAQRESRQPWPETPKEDAS